MRRLSLAAIALSIVALHAASATASVTQESILQDDNQLKANPTGTMQTLRDLGVQRIRVNLSWGTVAPAPTSARRPKGFNASDPAAYAVSAWAPYDAIDRAGAADGIAIDFTIDGLAPYWATGSGVPRGTSGYFRGAWQPSASEFGSFVRAVGTRYSGTYKPRGSSTALPRVNFWSIWNEPNYGYDIAPQGIGAGQSIPNSPHVYRNLLGAAWSALQASGHGTRTDRILFGEVTPHGVNAWGVFSNMKPLIFLRSLYCVDSGYRPLGGSAAAAQGCPTTTAGTRGFRRQNPALFSAGGFAVHPYEQASAPNTPTHLCGTKLCVGAPSDPDFADLPEIPRLERTLDRLNAVYGSRTHFAIWSTEYGFRTKPPDPNLGISQATAAIYMNWAEYLSYLNPRLRSYDQYLLVDPVSADFASGLELPHGQRKMTFDAFELPVFMPSTTVRAGGRLLVWGCVRPGPAALSLTGLAQNVAIQFRASARAPFHTLTTVTIGSPRGYFETKLVFTQSGAIRLAWTSPAGRKVYSRTVPVTINRG